MLVSYSAGSPDLCGEPLAPGVHHDEDDARNVEQEGREHCEQVSLDGKKKKDALSSLRRIFA